MSKWRMFWRASMLVAAIALSLGLDFPERGQAAEAGGGCVAPYDTLCGIWWGPFGPIPFYGDYSPQAQ